MSNKDLITINELQNLPVSERKRLSSPEMVRKLDEIKRTIEASEDIFLSNLKICSDSQLKILQNKLPNIDVEKFKSELRSNFYNSEFMKAILCVSNSIFYYSPESQIAPNIRIKRWIKNLVKLSEGAEGYAFNGSLDNADDVFIIKVPKSAEVDLTHELVIGLQLNKLREYVPNFAYVFGAFRCTSPVMIPEGNRPVSWCNKRNGVSYIVYENISPGVTLEEYCRTCTFKQFLDKFLQLNRALSLAYKMYKYTHYDLHYKNVIIRESGGEPFYIVYTDNFDKVIYLKTDSVATIIDYGFNHLIINGKHYGISHPALAASGVYPDIAFQIYDSFKLLMFCAYGMMNSGNITCLSRTIDLIKFFNRSEDLYQMIKLGFNTLFALPWTPKTKDISVDDLYVYIRNFIPEFNDIISETPPMTNSNILGCFNGNVCMSQEETLKSLNIDKTLTIDNIFDFYDIVSKLENEGKDAEIQDALNNFNYQKAYEDAIFELEDLKAQILDYAQQLNYIIKIEGMTLESLSNPEFINSYRIFLLNILASLDIYQHFDIIFKSVEFFLKYYNISDVSNYYALKDWVTNFQQDFDRITAMIHTDYTYIIKTFPGNTTVFAGIPELETIGKLYQIEE